MGRKKIIFLVLLIMILISIIYVIGKKNDNKLKIDSKEIFVNNNRQYESYSVLDSLNMVDDPAYLYNLNNDNFYFFRYQNGGFGLYNIENESLDSFGSKDRFYYNVKKVLDTTYALSRAEVNNSVVISLEKYVDHRLISENIIKHNDENITGMGFLEHDKFYVMQDVNDSLGIKIYNNSNAEVSHTINLFDQLGLSPAYYVPQYNGVTYQGKVLSVSSKEILYKNALSSYGFIYNLENKKSTIVRNIDSLDIVLATDQDMGDGIVMTSVDDSKYRIMSIKKYKNDILLIEANMMENKLLLNCFDLNFNYRFSIDLTKTNFYPSDFEVIEENGVTKILLLSSKNNKLYTIKMDKNGLFE